MIDYSGIYVIENTINRNRYVGSAVSLRTRRNYHFQALRNGMHDNGHLQNAFNLYGEDAFEFKPILICEKFELLRYEQDMINALVPEYNICKMAGSCLGRKDSPESRGKKSWAKLGKKKSTETRAKMSRASFGRKMSPKTREKLSQAHLGSRHSAESREKMSRASLGKKKSPEAIEKTRLFNLGRKRSPEAIEKTRQANLGRKHSPESKEKMRQSALARWKILHLRDEETEKSLTSGLEMTDGR